MASTKLKIVGTFSGQRIRCARLLRGLSQPQLSKLMGIPQQRISAVERSKKGFHSTTLIAFAIALDIPSGDLMPPKPK